jgi:hypothetical protein
MATDRTSGQHRLAAPNTIRLARPISLAAVKTATRCPALEVASGAYSAASRRDRRVHVSGDATAHRDCGDELPRTADDRTPDAATGGAIAVEPNGGGVGAVWL